MANVKHVGLHHIDISQNYVARGMQNPSVVSRIIIKDAFEIHGNHLMLRDRAGTIWSSPSMTFKPHCYVLCTDGCFDGMGLFRVAPRIASEGLKAISEHKVFRMLLSKRKILPDLITLLRSWRHSGFQVYAGPRIQPEEEHAMGKLARYIIRASFSEERMTYLPEESMVIYESKNG